MKVEIKLGYLIGIVALLALVIWLIVSVVGGTRQRIIDELRGLISLPDTVFVYDTTLYTFYDTIPIPVTVIDSVSWTFYDTLTYYDTIPIAEPRDTSAIIDDYYRLRIYNEVFADERLEFHLWEQVGANRVLKRSTSYRILQPTSVITQKKHYIYLGLSAGNKGAAPTLTYTNDRFYAGAGYDPLNGALIFSGGVRVVGW